MKITVITATKNNAPSIGDTIASVMQQSHTDIDYIIIDGNSDDGSQEIIDRWLQRYPHRIRFISEPDAGVYQAINKGIAIAKGEIIGTLHGNDRFSSHRILEQVADAMKDSGTDMIYGDIHYISPRTGKTTRHYSAKYFTPDMLKIGIAPPHPSLYVRKEVFSQFGTYKEDYLIGADFDMFVRLLLVNNAKSAYLPIDMVTMTNGGLSTRLYHRVFTNNREKFRALKENSIPISRFSLLKRYLYNLKQ